MNEQQQLVRLFTRIAEAVEFIAGGMVHICGVQFTPSPEPKTGEESETEAEAVRVAEQKGV